MPKMKDLTGQRFGRLTAIKPTDRRSSRSVVWECKCDCGEKACVSASSLLSGSTRSCGCLVRESAPDNNKKDCKYGTKVSALTSKLSAKNTSGHKGISWDKAKLKWHASIRFQTKLYHLGDHENIEDAIKARAEAEEKYFKPILEKENR